MNNNTIQPGDLVEYTMPPEERMWDKEKTHGVVLRQYPKWDKIFVEILWDDGEVNERHISVVKFYE